MAVWKPTFLHEFPDGDLTNHYAVPGEIAVLPGGPLVGFPPELRGFAVHPGRSLVYRLAEPLSEVIGVDLSAEPLIPPQGEVASFPVVSLGGGRVTLSVHGLRFAFVGPELRGTARVAFEVDGERMEVEQSFGAEEPLRLRARWHTHGQTQLWREGTLRAHEPGLAAGRTLGLDRLVVGGPEGVIVDPGASFRVHRVYLKVLREDDARKEIDRHVAIDERYLRPTPCAERVRALHGELLAQGRRFMTEALAALTASWREGQPDGPFSSEAVAAHAAAVGAAEAFGSFLDTGNEAAADAVVERIGEFLDLLAATDPAGFAELLADLTARAETLDPYCREELQPIYAANSERLEPLAELLRRTWSRALEARPGGPHA